MNIDQQVNQLCDEVARSVGERVNKGRVRRLREAARELDLKPGSSLGACGRVLEQDPTSLSRVETLIGNWMLHYALNTRIGFAVAAAHEDEDPSEVIARLISRAAASTKARTKKAKNKPAKGE